MPYPHQEIEKKWQERWVESGRYQTPDKKKGSKNFYCLVEFPYPSGNLHIGHWYAFAVPDIFARFKRLKGLNVLYPIGFDSFGLPAENAAIKHGADPRKWTYDNIEVMMRQLKSMGASFDWSRKVVASDPAYYRWTQWLFLKMYNKGLAYRGRGLVNWDPVDQTVLANEQVLPDGTAERSGAKVEKRELEQWFVKITDYADRLLADLEELKWPEEIKEAQRNWIGRSEGAEIVFVIPPLTKGGQGGVDVHVFTTRPDTLFGATYLVLAPEHPLIVALGDRVKNFMDVRKYQEAAKAKSQVERTDVTREKTGVELKGIMAVNPATGKDIPVWVADYVLMGYGTGAIMAVPAHDERDFAFAKKFGLPIRRVILNTAKPGEGSYALDPSSLDRLGTQDDMSECYTGSGTLINSGKFNGMKSEEAQDAITKKVGGKKTVQYRLRDWLISRQRYWGCPIPIVYDPAGKPHPIPEKYLPWLLPEDVNFKPTGTSPLGTSRELAERTEKIFGKGWRPELDTMDTFVDSSWYFLRYTDPRNEKKFADKKKLKAWMPVNRYSGGAEHTTMHLLYSRFFHKALFDLGLVAQKEPYQERFNRGIILGMDGQKMSKRWGNVVNPDEQVEQYGADAVRMYLAFIGPYQEVGSYPWQPTGLAGVRRFLDKVWRLQEQIGGDCDEGVERVMHKTIKKVGEDIEAFKFNTAIAQLMKCVNEWQAEFACFDETNPFQKKSISKKQLSLFFILLAPFAPHLAEELWEKLGATDSVFDQPWPTYDPKLVKDELVAVAVQVNGKLRGTVDLSPDAAESDAVAAAKSVPNVAKYLAGATIKKAIYIPGRMINFVVDKII